MFTYWTMRKKFFDLTKHLDAPTSVEKFFEFCSDDKEKSCNDNLSFKKDLI